MSRYSNADVSIEAAKHADINVLAQLLQQLFAIEADFNYETVKVRRGLEYLLEDERGCLLVARSRGEVLGMCSAQLLISTAEGGYSAWVEDLVVDQDHRGNGIGRRLLSAISAWAHEQGATRLQLLADYDNRPALYFYRCNGWRATQLQALRLVPGH